MRWVQIAKKNPQHVVEKEMVIYTKLQNPLIATLETATDSKTHDEALQELQRGFENRLCFDACEWLLRPSYAKSGAGVF